MAQTLDRLMASAQGFHFRNEAQVNAWLDRQEVRDPTLRIAFKHLAAAGALATDQERRMGLVTDLPTRPPAAQSRLMPELESLMRRAGIEPGRRYTERQIDALLRDAGLSTEQKIGIKTEMLSRQWLA
jgi:hypothetical protein